MRMLLAFPFCIAEICALLWGLALHLFAPRGMALDWLNAAEQFFPDRCWYGGGPWRKPAPAPQTDRGEG